jgi:signal transduction histidine kinase
MTIIRSLTVRVLLASFGTLILSLIASVAVFIVVSRPVGEPRMLRLQLVGSDEALSIYERDGAKALSAYLRTLDERAAGRHYFTDAAGRDVLDGTDRSALLGPEGRPRRGVGGAFVLEQRLGDGRYRLLFMGVRPAGPIEFLRYYLVLVLAIAGLLYWWLWLSITSPLRALSGAVERFGRGQLDVRAPAPDRRDEIGDLGRAFNSMALRIQTLVTAERRLLQDISHELRSPLARLTVAIELFQTSPDHLRASAQVQRDLGRLAGLVDSLLEATREEGDLSISVAEPIDVWRVVVSVADSCAIEAIARGCHLNVNAPGGGGTVNGHAELLRRAIENVVRNAIRYAPGGSAIDVEMRGDGDSSTVVVRDHGPGVPVDDLPLLGTPFFRVESARDAKTGGVGLGLAIARRAVLAHRGTFLAENAFPGLRITMRIPTT